MTKLRGLDLFSGIGGFSLGLDRAGGFETVAFCEIEPFCQKVLAKHWPGVPIYDDVRTLTADTLARDGIGVDVICGGFPCQDISVAGKRAGLAGERSGLWSEYRRLIGELRPRFAIIENVPGILSSGAGTVLADLAALGFDAMWECIPASAVGAPHRRDRWWCVGWNSNHERCNWQHRQKREIQIQDPNTNGTSKAVANANPRNSIRRRRDVQMGWQPVPREIENDGYDAGTQWTVEPDVGRMAYGISSRVDRLGGLGNAVVPQVVQLIGSAILEASHDWKNMPEMPN